LDPGCLVGFFATNVVDPGVFSREGQKIQFAKCRMILHCFWAKTDLPTALGSVFLKAMDYFSPEFTRGICQEGRRSKVIRDLWPTDVIIRFRL